MGQDLDKVNVVTQHAEVQQFGEKIILPTGMSALVAVDILMKRVKYYEEPVAISEEYDVFPWDGANALHAVLATKYGWANSIPTPTFFGPKPPTTVQIEVGYQLKKSIIWGRFGLPGVDGYLECSTKTLNSGRMIFVLNGEVKRKNEEMVKELCALVREYLKIGSIYRGKALRIRFLADDGSAYKMPDIRFLNPDAVHPSKLILSRHIHEAVETNLYTPIRRVRELRQNGLPIKRGILLGGTYGTGKTLAAAVASYYAHEQGVLYMVVERADELARAIEFAKQYQEPACVIFCEDVDRVTSGDRSVEMDDILNIIDGIDSKSSNLIVVLTTNEMEKINPAMLRPGRLDAVIEVTPPDGEAIERLLRYYGGGCIAEETNLEAVGKVLSGNIPAVIEEVVKRAKLTQLKLNQEGELVMEISEAALLESAQTMQGQLDLLKRRIQEGGAEAKVTVEDLFSKSVEKALSNGGMAFVQDAVEKAMNKKLQPSLLK